MIEGERVDDTTKGGRSRVVALDASTVAVLREHRRQLAERLKAGPLWVETELVFTAEDGRPLYPDTVTALMRKLIADYNAPAVPGRGGATHAGRCPRRPLPTPAAPLPPARLHDLRHVHATTLLLAGVPVHVVANRLGTPTRRPRCGCTRAC